MDGGKDSAKTVKLRPVRPIARKAFKVRLIPKSRHAPLKPIIRPPWNDENLRCKSKKQEKTTTCTVENIEMPCPDYTCFEASRFYLNGDVAIPAGDVVVMKKNYKPAVWCDPVRRYRQVKHCTDITCGKAVNYDIDMPSPFRTEYVDLAGQQKMLALGDYAQTGVPLYMPVMPQDQGASKQNKKAFYENVKVKEDAASMVGQAYQKVGRYGFLPY